MDTGFLDADLFVQSRDAYGVDLLGPTRLDYHWQARAGSGFDAQHFLIDWAQQHASCPAGKTGISWTPAVDNRGNAVIKVKFSSKDCRRCDRVSQCIRSKKCFPRRTLTIRPQPKYQALQAARQREATEAFHAEYARCAGIEGTISRGTRSTRLRRTRYIGDVNPCGDELVSPTLTVGARTHLSRPLAFCYDALSRKKLPFSVKIESARHDKTVGYVKIDF